MIVIFVALLETLLYLCAVPVCAAVCLTWDDGVRVGVGVGAFERRFALKRARRARRALSLQPDGGGMKGFKAAWNALRRTRGMVLSLSGSLGLGDAAATAMACGALQALGAALGAGTGRVAVDVRPAFNALEPSASLQGMIRVRAGQIIIAVARSNMDSIKWRIAQWKDIPSKA